MLGSPDDLELTGAVRPLTSRPATKRPRPAEIRSMPAIVLEGQRDRTFTGWDLPNYDDIVSQAPSRTKHDAGTEPIGP
jgi:hypothetical protein